MASGSSPPNDMPQEYTFEEFSRLGAEPADDNPASAIKSVAGRLGVDPLDLATAISYETNFTFSPSIRGGKGNKYLGLIQFGDEERAKYGVHEGQSVVEQSVPVEQYLRDRGVKPGADLPMIYKAINPTSNVAEHIAKMGERGDRAKAAAFLAPRGVAQAAPAKTFSFEEFASLGVEPAPTEPPGAAVAAEGKGEPSPSWKEVGQRFMASFGPSYRQALGGLIRGLGDAPMPEALDPRDNPFIEKALTKFEALPQAERTPAAWNAIVAAVPKAPTALAAYGAEMEAEAAKQLEALRLPGEWYSSPKKVVESVGRGVVSTVPAIGAGVLTRSPAVGLGTMGAQVFGSKYGEERRQGTPADKAALAAALYGAAEIVGERAVIGSLLKPGAGLWKKAGTVGVGEAKQEVLTETLQMGVDLGILDEKMTIADAASRLGEATVGGIALGGGLGLASHPFIGREPPPPPPPPSEPQTTTIPPAEPATAPPVSEPAPPAPPVAPPVETDTPTPVSPAAPGREAVFTARGTAIEVQPRIADAGALVTSHTVDLAENPAYPAGLQPRDRTRAGSEEQINNIAANLRPELLGPSALASEGAPIIGPDGIVESGNARVLAILRVYAGRPERARAYVDWLEKQGFDLQGLQRPILVRRRVTPLDPKAREAFAREANERTTAAMSTSEQAMTDAKTLTPAHLGLYKGGALTGGHNAAFVRAFLEAAVPTSERGALYTKEGGLSQAGAARIEGEMFAMAFEDAELLSALREDPDTNIKSIGGALTDVAPAWVQMRSEAATGKIAAHVDITPAVQDAVKLVRKARSQGHKIVDLVNQTDIFKGGVSRETKAVLRLMFKTDTFTSPASRKDIAAALEFYATEARKQQPGPALIGEVVKPIDILELARQKREGGLFGEAAQRREPRADEGPVHASRGNATNVLFSKPGANYVGMAQGAASAPRRAVPIRRRDIIDKLVKAINQPIYQGRVPKQMRALGFFRPKIKEIRIRDANSFETAAHEVAHWFDETFDAIRKQWSPGTKANAVVRAELAGVSYDKKKLFEGFAEFVRLWMTQDHMLSSRAPHFKGWWEDWLERDPKNGGPGREIRDAMYAAKKEMHDWLAQDPLDRLRSRHGADVVNRIHQIKHSLFEDMRQGIINGTFGFERAEKGLYGQIRPGGMTQTARLAARASALIDGAFTQGVPTWHPKPWNRAGVQMPGGMVTFDGAGLFEILDPVAEDIDDFINFAVARSAYELKQQGRENLIPDDEIAAGLRLGQQNPEFVRVFEQEYQAWNRGIVQFAVDLGAIDPEKRATWRRQMYLPFWRATMPKSAGFYGRGSMPGEWRGIHRLTGGTGELRDILHNIFGNASMLIKAAVVNHARQTAIDDVMRHPNSGHILAQIPGDSHPVQALTFSIKNSILEAYEQELKTWADDEAKAGKLTTQEIENGVKDRRRDFEDAVDSVFDLLTMASLSGISPKGAPNQKDNVIVVLRRGKPAYYEVADELWMRSYIALNRPVKNAMWRALALPTRVARSLITLSPNFMLRQIFRDPVTAWHLAKGKHWMFLSPARGLIRILKKDQVYRDAVANGFGFHSRFVDDDTFARHVRRKMDRFYTRKGINPRSVIDTPERFIEMLEVLGTTIENMSRMAEYANTVEAGAHPREGVFLSSEVTTDFSPRGDYEMLQNIIDTMLFVRPGILGADRFVRALASDKHRGRVWAKMIATSAIMAAIALWNEWNPLYDDLDDFDKDANVHLFIPLPAYFDFVKKHGRRPKTPSEAQGLFWLDGVRMPKSYEVAIMWSFAERSVIEAIRYLDEAKTGGEAMKDWARGMWAAFTTMFLPDARPPQAVSGLYDVYGTNRDPMTGAPIIPEREKNMPPWMQYGTGTSMTGRAIAKTTKDLPTPLQISPRRFDYFLRSYLGTIGAMSLQMLDRIVDDTQPDLAARRWPLAGVVLESQSAGRYPRLAAELIAEADGAYAAAKKLYEEGRKELADEIVKSIPVQRHRTAMRVQDAMGALRGFMSNAVLAANLETARARALEWAASEFATEKFKATMQRDEIWRDIGAIKAAMRDDITMTVREQSKRGYEALKSVGKQPVPLPGWRPAENRSEP